jgi:hypothetical protein
MRTKEVKNPELSKKMSSDLRKTAAEITGKSKRYVDQVLNPNDKRYNQDIIETCKQLLHAKEKAIHTIKVHIRRGDSL